MKNYFFLIVFFATTQIVIAQGNFEFAPSVNVFTEKNSIASFDPLFSLKGTVYLINKESLSFGAFGEVGTNSYTSFLNDEYFSLNSNIVSFGAKLKYFLSTNGFNPYVSIEAGDSFLFTEERLRSFTVRGIFGFEVPFNNSDSSWFMDIGYSFAQYGETEFAFTNYSPEIFGANSFVFSTGFRFWKIGGN
jgi:hypothetical protein